MHGAMGGTSSSSSKGGSNKWDSSEGDRKKDDDLMVARQLIEIPDTEVIVLNAAGSEGGVMKSGRLQLMSLQPKSKKDRPGRYRITKAAQLCSERRHNPSKVIGELLIGTCINVLEVAIEKEDMRVRGRVEDPAGWISLQRIRPWTEVAGPDGREDRWAEKLNVAVIYVGTAEFRMDSDSDDSTGFYYPLVPETPLVFAYEARLISVSANDGDTFTVRLPKELPEAKLWELINTLPNYCNFRLEKKKDAADHVSEATNAIAGGIDKAAAGLAGMMQRRGAAARKNMKKQEDLQIGLGTKLLVGTLRTGTRATATVTNAAVDALMGTAMAAGKEAGRRAGMDEQRGAPGPGRAALGGSLQVFDALVRAGEMLAGTATDEVAGVVAHRYGGEAGEVARGAMEAGTKAVEVAAMAKGDKALTKVTGRLAAKSATYKLAARAIKPMAQGFAEGARESAARSSGARM